MSSKQELLTDIETAYKEFRASFEDIEEPEFYTKWLDQRYGVREIVAQHVGWLGQFAGELHRSAMQNGWDQQGWVQWDDMETWDDTFSEHARGKDKSQIMHELEQAVSSFKEAVARVPDEQFRDAEVVDKMAHAVGLRQLRKHAALIGAWSQQHPKSRRSPIRRLLAEPTADTAVIKPLLGIVGFVGVADSLWLVLARKDWGRFWTAFVRGASKQRRMATGLAALELAISLLFIRHAFRRTNR